jgi:hypothetical protein
MIRITITPAAYRTMIVTSSAERGHCVGLPSSLSSASNCPSIQT